MAADRSVITFEMTTLRRTGHSTEAIEVPHPRLFNHPSDPSRPPAVLIWEEEEKEVSFACGVTVSLATWPTQGPHFPVPSTSG